MTENSDPLWMSLKHLFEEDDGSLPDVYVEPLTNEQVIQIYEWVRSKSAIYGDPLAWSIKEQRDIPIRELLHPAKSFMNGEIESFRHGLADFKFSEVQIPELTIEIGQGAISFDYRMGKAWGPSHLAAFFDFLSEIKRQVPNVRIYQADEGCQESPNVEFENALQLYCGQSPS